MKRTPLSAALSALLLTLASLLVSTSAEASRASGASAVAASQAHAPGVFAPEARAVERALALGDGALETDTPQLALFAGDELDAVTRTGAPAFHLDGAELPVPPLASEVEASYPKTRVRAFDFLGQEVIGVERELSLTLHWGSGHFGLELASGSGNWLSEDPAGTIDSPSLYAFVGNRPNLATDPTGTCVFGIPCPGPIQGARDTVLRVGEAAANAFASAGTQLVGGLKTTYEHGPAPLLREATELADRVHLYGQMAARPWEFSTEQKNLAARQLLLDIASVGMTAQGLRGSPLEAPPKKATAPGLLTADSDLASTVNPRLGQLREVVGFLKREGITDPGLRRSIVEAGLESSISAETPTALARFRRLFLRPLREGKALTGRLGDVSTRVATVNEAMAIERAGLLPVFEFRVGRNFVDVSAIDPATGRVAWHVQLVRELQPGVYSSREIPNASAITVREGKPVFFRVVPPRR